MDIMVKIYTDDEYMRCTYRSTRSWDEAMMVLQLMEQSCHDCTFLPTQGKLVVWRGSDLYLYYIAESAL